MWINWVRPCKIHTLQTEKWRHIFLGTREYNKILAIKQSVTPYNKTMPGRQHLLARIKRRVGIESPTTATNKSSTYGRHNYLVDLIFQSVWCFKNEVKRKKGTDLLQFLIFQPFISVVSPAQNLTEGHKSNRYISCFICCCYSCHSKEMES